MTAGSEPRRWPGADLALRLAGGVVTLAASLLTGLLMFVTVPWRVSTFLGLVRIPVAVVVVVGGLAALFWYAPRATGTRWAALLPLAAWSVTVLVGLGVGDPGGALLLADDWVAALCLFGGTVVAVVGAVLTLRGRPGVPGMPGTPRVPPEERRTPPGEPRHPPGERRIPPGERRHPPDRPAGGNHLR